MKFLLTKRQQRKIGDLMANHRAVEECADYLESPTMQAMLQYVDRLVQKERERREACRIEKS